MYLTVDSPLVSVPSARESRVSAGDEFPVAAHSTIRMDKAVGRLIDGMVEGRIEILAIQTAKAVAELEAVAKRLGRRFGLITGLRRVIKICGDGGAVDALGRLGLDADVVAHSPHSPAEFAATLHGMPVGGMCVAVVYQDEPESVVARSVASRCRTLEGYFVA